MQKFCISHEEAPKKVKTLRKQCAVMILTLTLAFSAYAGQIQGPGAVTDTTGTGPVPITGTSTLLYDLITTTVVTIVSVIP
jgi:hypothetical protein